MTLQDSMMTLHSSINEHLEKLVSPSDGPNAPLFEAARYSLLLPGKRLRPLFLLNILQDYEIPIEKGLDVACALEMIHTYSLIHDDLPCMDDDDLRRGKPTLHKLYGEGQAILAGDFLLTYAFEVLAKGGYSPEIITIIAQAAGGNGMIGGQVVDLLFEGKEIDWETLKFMYLGKTAALFAAACECAAVISNAKNEERMAFKTAGEYFGIAFQMKDDILDITSNEAELGKPIGSDIANNKTNCLTLFGKEKAEELAKAFYEKALNSLPEWAENTSILLKYQV